MKHYTYEKAVEAVLNLKDRIGNMPSETDLCQNFSEQEIDTMYNVLLAGSDFENSVPNKKCAFIVIAVVRELRNEVRFHRMREVGERNGQKANASEMSVNKIPWSDKPPLNKSGASEEEIPADIAAEIEAELGGC